MVASPSNNPSGFAGQIEGINLLELINFYCMTGWSGMLTVHAGMHTGKLVIEGGDVVYAETESSQGDQAFYKIMDWHGGRFSIRQGKPGLGRNISCGWQTLILEAAMKVDLRLNNHAEAQTSSAEEIDNFCIRPVAAPVAGAAPAEKQDPSAIIVPLPQAAPASASPESPAGLVGAVGFWAGAAEVLVEAITVASEHSLPLRWFEPGHEEKIRELAENSQILNFCGSSEQLTGLFGGCSRGFTQERLEAGGIPVVRLRAGKGCLVYLVGVRAGTPVIKNFPCVLWITPEAVAGALAEVARQACPLAVCLTADPDACKAAAPSVAIPWRPLAPNTESWARITHTLKRIFRALAEAGVGGA